MAEDKSDEPIYKWAAKSLGKKILNEASDVAFGALLKEIGLGGDPNAEMRKAFAEVNSKLDQIQTQLSHITQKIDSLRTELKFSTAELRNVIEAVSVREARNVIQRAYGGGGSRRATLGSTAQSAPERAGFAATATSLAELVRRHVNGEAIPPASIEKFCENILSTWDIPTKIKAINTALVGDAATGGAAGLLSAWVDLSTLKMGERKQSPDLMTHYQLIEQNFLYYLGFQLEGLVLVMNAKSYGSSNLGNDYLENEFMPMFRDQCAVFLQRVELLVMRQCDFRSPWPAPKVTKKEGEYLYPMSGVAPDIDRVLLRSYLLYIYLLASLTSEEYDAGRKGVFAHLFCRERDIVDGKGPRVELISGMNAKTGMTLPASGVLAPKWDSSGNNYALLKEPDDLNDRVRLVRYFWHYEWIGHFQTQGKSSNQAYDLNTGLFRIVPDTLELFRGDYDTVPEAIRQQTRGLQNFTDFTRLQISRAPQISSSGITSSSVEGLDRYLHADVRNNIRTKTHLLCPDIYSCFSGEFQIGEQQTSDFKTMTWRVTAPSSGTMAVERER